MFMEGFALISICQALRFVSSMMSKPIKWKTLMFFKSEPIACFEYSLRKGISEMIVFEMVSLIYFFIISGSMPFSLASFCYT